MKVLDKSLVFIFLLIIFISSASARSNREQENQKISIYLHPISFACAWVYSHGDTTNVFSFYMIYSTVKIPFNLSNSLIIQPSLWYGESSKGDIFRLGSGIGFRHFVNGKGDGWYLQAMSSIHYYSKEELSDSIYEKGFYADLLGYLGYSWKISVISMFLDTGIGFTTPVNRSSREFALGTLGYKRPLVFDMNLGMGFSF